MKRKLEVYFIISVVSCCVTTHLKTQWLTTTRVYPLSWRLGAGQALLIWACWSGRSQLRVAWGLGSTGMSETAGPPPLPPTAPLLCELQVLRGGHRSCKDSRGLDSRTCHSCHTLWLKYVTEPAQRKAGGKGDLNSCWESLQRICGYI